MVCVVVLAVPDGLLAGALGQASSCCYSATLQERVWGAICLVGLGLCYLGPRRRRVGGKGGRTGGEKGAK
jgi:hypothetical protein